MFTSFSQIRTFVQTLPQASEEAQEAAQARNAQLTKPAGSLGRLEALAVWYCGWRGVEKTQIKAPQVAIFAGNHGVAALGVSAFPAEVTFQMVANFQAGGAAVNQLATLAQAQFSVHPLELETPTHDFTQGPAMDEARCLAAINAGWDAVDAQSDLLIVGEMGIGNTTSAAAIACALVGGDPAQWVGRGTGVDAVGIALKADVVARGLKANQGALDDPLAVLAALGGREIAAMYGAMLRARHESIPMILDGFICSAAALVLHHMAEGALDHCVAGHQSDEHAHADMLAALGKSPLLDLGLRLGEGSGAATAILLLKAAVATHSGMATFAEAGVSGSDDGSAEG